MGLTTIKSNKIGGLVSRGWNDLIAEADIVNSDIKAQYFLDKCLSGESRKCRSCPTVLSIYNQTDYCYSCSKKDPKYNIVCNQRIQDPDADVVLEIVGQNLDLTTKELLGFSSNNSKIALGKGIAIYFLVRYLNKKRFIVGRIFGIGEKNVSYYTNRITDLKSKEIIIDKILYKLKDTYFIVDEP